jgi:radical SAM protein with 4Fe4S-binding SPASM domain
MASKEKNWIERKERIYLKEVLPLDTPFSMQIETIRACNFKCIYCAHSVKSSPIKYEILSLNLFEKFINDLKQFPEKLKSLIFSGMGEPLLNKDLPQMITLAKEVSEKVIVITNGSLLTPEISKKLIDAGLDTVRISLQGLNSEDYVKTCGFNLDFDKFVSNIEFLYKNKNQCEVYVKITDISVDTEEKKQLFYNIFERICDSVTIQAISPVQNQVDYTKIKTGFSTTVYNEGTPKVIQTCPQPFYSMQLLADGKIRPCCMLEVNDFFIGDINIESIFDIWNGNKMQQMRMIQMNKLRFNHPACKECVYPVYLDNKYDNLEDAAEELMEKFKAGENLYDKKRK